MPRLNVLLTGDYRHREFEGPVRWLEQHTQLTVADPFDRAADELTSTGLAPHLVVIAQARPGQYSRRAVERLLAHAPLARPVALLGSWCEGEIRTGTPWPGILRVYWHEWAARAESLLQQSLASVGWDLPRTATDPERLLRASAARLATSRGLIVVRANLLVDYEGLAEAAALGGYATVWLPPGQPARFTGAAACLWHRAPETCDEREELVRIADEMPLVLILDFPRREDVQWAMQAGASAILPQPLLLHDLLGVLHRALAASPVPVAAQREAA